VRTIVTIQMLDEHLIMRCLELARESQSKGEAPVGSVIARGDQIIAEGRERTKELLDHSAHAELQAIQAACRVLGTENLNGLAIYSNVEPCVMCAYVIRRAGLARVVFGVSAGQAGGSTSQYALLSDASLRGWSPPPEIQQGVLLDVCLQLMKAFSHR
jgi:tRNA(adenine34) deaminase